MSERYQKIIGICGVATVGKDTLFKIINSINPAITRLALADELKLDCDAFFRQKLGISAFTTDIKEKNLIRPLFVDYGDIKRKQSLGTYWTSLLQPKIEDCMSRGDIPCVTDIRYDEYQGVDELDWIKKNNGVLIHVSRREQGVLIEPANDREKINNPRLMAAADYKLVWSTSSDISYLLDCVNLQLGGFIETIR